jgi:hypothetical protein
MLSHSQCYSVCNFLVFNILILESNSLKEVGPKHNSSSKCKSGKFSVDEINQKVEWTVMIMSWTKHL